MLFLSALRFTHIDGISTLSFSWLDPTKETVERQIDPHGAVVDPVIRNQLLDILPMHSVIIQNCNSFAGIHPNCRSLLAGNVAQNLLVVLVN